MRLQVKHPDGLYHLTYNELSMYCLIPEATLARWPQISERLRIAMLAGVLFEEIVLFELFDKRAVACDLLLVERFFALQHPNLAADLECVDQVAAGGERRQHDDQKRRSDPEFAHQTAFHRVRECA